MPRMTLDSVLTETLAEQVNIMLVDDRPEGLIALEAVLKCPEYNLVKVSSGREALAQLLNFDFAVILLDVQMPEMDGFQTAKIIKKNPLFRHIPILFVTAINKEQRHIDEGYESGAVDYLFKPFDPQVLKCKVSVFVDLYRKNVQIREQTRLLLQSERRERERRVNELELENLKKYRNLADAIPHIVWKMDPDGNVDYFNRYWFEYTGIDPAEKAGDRWSAVFQPEDYLVFLQAFKEARKLKGIAEAHCRIKGKSDGRYRWHLVRIVPETLDGTLKGWIVTCTDIHASKEAEENLELKIQHRTQELSKLNRVLQKEMEERMKAQKEVLEISEREQKRIGQDLHDGLAQELVAISFMSQILEQKLTERGVPEIADARKIQDLIKKAVQETRSLSRGFYPIELERHGLIAAVQEMVVNAEAMFSIRFDYRCDPDIVIRDKAMAYHLYRITQEAIHNIIKHGKADLVKVSIYQEDSLLLLSIKDNGIGFRMNGEAVPGMGLRTMQYRARMIGAVLTIQSEPGKGTTILCKSLLPDPLQDAISAQKEEVS